MRSGVQGQAEQVAKSESMGWVARIGLTSRGIVYIAMGWLAALLAFGGSARADQGGVLTSVAREPYGMVLLWVLAAGFLAYAVWRVSEALFGVTGTDNSIGARLKSAGRAVPYLGLFFAALAALRGANVSQSERQPEVAASLMSQPGGQWIVGIVGVAMVVIGVLMVNEGITTKFLKYFEYLRPPRRTIVAWMGRIGSIARGAVVGIAGGLVMEAAWTDEPARAGGIDTAFRTLLAQPYGRPLVLALGLALILFGIYGLAEAAWRRVPGDNER